jgi:hypothetical protein
MLIEEQKLQHWIDHFYGYGSWKAKYWFIAYEEGGGDVPEDVADKINWFYDNHKTNELCDVRELYRHVRLTMEGPKAERFATRYDYRFGNHAVQHGVWKNLIAFTHGYENEDIPDLLAYQKDKFATTSEAVIQFYPLPSPHNHAWYYSWLDIPGMSFLKSRSLYEDHCYQKRVDGLLSKIKEHKPEIVLMYGMSNINMLKASIQAAFPGTVFKLAKAEKLVTPQYHRADVDGTRLVITTRIPALRHGRAETGFEWAKFGQILRP